jgi:hypothetical protein
MGLQNGFQSARGSPRLQGEIVSERRGWRAAAALSGAVVFALFACAEADDGDVGRKPEETRAIMQNLFESLRGVLPLSVDQAALADPENAEQVEAALLALSTNASLASDHMATEQTSMRALWRNVERDSSDMLNSFQAGRTDRTGFLLRQITENCVVCHSRLPSAGDSPLAEHFIDGTALRALPAERRATLQIATRRFDDALDTLEQIITQPTADPVLLLGPLTDYLTVSIRVKGDFERPVGPLTQFAARPRLWERLRMDVEQWLTALPQLGRRAVGKPSLATARAIFEEGQQITLAAGSRAALVHNIAASAMLERFIDTHAETGLEVGEAYYLLGLTETQAGRNYWVTQGPLFLETAIRLAPAGGFAPDAYAMLEEQLLLSYEGSDYEELPEEDAAHLKELWSLMQQAGAVQ